MSGVRIGEVAARSGVSVRALRYYEEQGLLESARTASGQRRYDDDAVDRVRLIQTLYAAGLGSRTIAQLLPCIHSGVLTVEQGLLLDAERVRISERIAELTAARDRLDAMLVASAPWREPQPA